MTSAPRSREVEVSDTLEAIEECYGMGWSDGLPVVPPVEYKVREMLDHAGMTGEEELISLEMRNRVITSENAAANAVMAGCLASPNTSRCWPPPSALWRRSATSSTWPRHPPVPPAS